LPSNSELAYLTNLAKKQNPSEKMLEEWFIKANLAFLLEFSMLGQLKSYDQVMGIYRKEIEDGNFQETVTKLLIRC